MARVVVVGSGLSGSRVAVRLAAKSPAVDIEVILVEAGPFSRRRHEGRDPHHHPGDARQRSWPDTGSDQWGPLSGAKARVGGRSLCWHGQLVALEEYARADWPAAWRERLPELSRSISAELAPPLEAAAMAPEWREAGLAAIAQAASLGPGANGTVDGWSAYTPLHLAEQLPNLSIISGAAVSSVRATGAACGSSSSGELDLRGHLHSQCRRDRKRGRARAVSRSSTGGPAVRPPVRGGRDRLPRRLAPAASPAR